MPSLTLLGQALVSGVLAGGIYGLLALGLSLSWGLLRLVNLAHFALALLGAYLTYQLGTALHLSPWLAAAAIVPAFFLLGCGLHAVFAYFRVTEFTSLLVTFGLTVILESLIQWFWTADYPSLRDAVCDGLAARGAAVHPHARDARLPDGRRAGVGHLGLAALQLRGQGAARERRGSGHGGGLRRQPPAAGVPAVRA